MQILKRRNTNESYISSKGSDIADYENYMTEFFNSPSGHNIIETAIQTIVPNYESIQNPNNLKWEFVSRELETDTSTASETYHLLYRVPYSCLVMVYYSLYLLDGTTTALNADEYDGWVQNTRTGQRCCGNSAWKSNPNLPYQAYRGSLWAKQGDSIEIQLRFLWAKGHVFEKEPPLFTSDEIFKGEISTNDDGSKRWLRPYFYLMTIRYVP